MHSKSWQYKSHCVRPVAWHWKVLRWALKTDGNQCCNYVQLFHFMCVCVCVLNLAVDLSLLSALCTLHTAHCSYTLLPHTWSFCHLLVSGTTGRKMCCIFLGWRWLSRCPRVPLRSWPWRNRATFNGNVKWPTRCCTWTVMKAFAATGEAWDKRERMRGRPTHLVSLVCVFVCVCVTSDTCLHFYKALCIT